MRNRRRYRQQQGQALAEGTAAMCMVFGSVVVAMFFVLNTGMGMFFKQKLTGVCLAAAAHASAHAGDSDVETETMDFVEELMPQVGIAPRNLSVAVSEINVGEHSGVQVTVSNTFPLFGSVNMLPTQIVLADSECVVF